MNTKNKNRAHFQCPTNVRLKTILPRLKGVVYILGFFAFFLPFSTYGYERQPSANVDTMSFAITIDSGLCAPTESIAILLKDMDSEELYAPKQECTTDCIGGGTLLISSPDYSSHDVRQLWLTCDGGLYGESPREQGGEGGEKMFGLWGYSGAFGSLLSPFFDNLVFILGALAFVIVTLWGVKMTVNILNK